MRKVWLITADQLSHKFCGYAGHHPWVRTPRIDRLAAEGAVFTNAYCSSPLCIPSRHSLYTGVGTRKHRCICDYKLLRHKTLFDHLADAGHSSCAVGKLDFRFDSDQSHGVTERPNADGGAQDVFWGTNNFSSFNGATVTTVDRETDGQCEAITHTTLDCLRRGDASLVYTSYVKPHESWDGVMWYDAPRRFWDLYADREFTDRRVHGYAANVSLFDHHLGVLLEAASRENLIDADTLIVFASDHGEMAGEHDRWGKQCMYEGSIKIPLVLFHRGMTPRRDPGVVGLVDVAATVFAWLGLPSPPGDGFSLLSPRPDDRHLFIEVFDGRHAHGVYAGWDGKPFTSLAAASPSLRRCIRQGEWKLVHDGRQYRLMNLESRDEMTTVARRHPEVFDRMVGLMESEYPPGGILTPGELKG